MTRRRPPRLAQQLLRVVVPPHLRDFVAGDAAEEFEHRAAREGVAPARRWYWRQVGAAVGAFVGWGRSSRPGRPSPGHGLGRGRRWAADAARDVSGMLRWVKRQPVLAGVLVGTLAIGIGANTLIFTVVHGVLFRPLPYAQPGELVAVWSASPQQGWSRGGVSLQDFEDWRRQAVSFAALGAYNVRSTNLTGERPERARYAMVTPSVLMALGVPPQLGRVFSPEENEPGRHDVIVVSSGFWQRYLGGRPSAVGETLRMNGEAVRVVGVMPAGFVFPDATVEIWRPFGMRPDDGGPRGARWVGAMGRLAPGRSLGDAQRELDGLTAALAAEYPRSNEGIGAVVEPLVQLQVASSRRALLVVWGAAALVLLVVIANVVNLQLVRAEDRQREIAVRRALGAGRSRLVRQLLAEGIVLAGFGGGLGGVVAWISVEGLLGLAAGSVPRVQEVGLDLAVVAFAAVLVTGVGTLIGLVPAWRAGGGGVGGLVRSGGLARSRGGERMVSALVVVEVSLAFAVTVGGTLLTRSFASLVGLDPGFDINGVLTARIAPPMTDSSERADIARGYGDLLGRLRALPGVEAVGAINRQPLSGNWWGTSIVADGRPMPAVGDRIAVNARVVTPGYFVAARIPLRRGRDFDGRDVAGTLPVGIVDEVTAERLWPGEDPMGRRFTMGDPEDPRVPWYTVVGVVGGVRHNTLSAAPTGLVYTALTQSYFGHFGDWGMDLIVRSAGPSHVLAEALSEAVLAVFPGVPTFDVRTGREVLGEDLAARRFSLLLMAAAATVAVGLAGVGVYGVLASGVARRAPEIGVRTAFGATASDILSLVVGRGLRQCGVGVVVGTAIAAGLTRVMDQMVYEVGLTDPAAFLVAAIIVFGMAVLASYGPARRAMRLDATEALRNE